jgi:hypothetical protein
MPARRPEQIAWLNAIFIGPREWTELTLNRIFPLYLPVAETDAGFVVVRTSRAPNAVAAEIRSTLHAIDPNLAASDIKPWESLNPQSARVAGSKPLLNVFAGHRSASRTGWPLRPHSIFRWPPPTRGGIHMALGAQRIFHSRKSSPVHE